MDNKVPLEKGIDVLKKDCLTQELPESSNGLIPVFNQGVVDRSSKNLDVVRIGGILENPNRLAVLRALKGCAKTHKGIATALGVDSATIYGHVEVLAKNGLVSVRKEATWGVTRDKHKQFCSLTDWGSMALGYYTVEGDIKFKVRHRRKKVKVADEEKLE